jgi:hypothetical protein
MDWDILPLQIILILQGVAVIGVSLMLIADSYMGESELGGHGLARRHWRRRDREAKPSATADSDSKLVGPG